jgi:hypothetical protein
MRTKRPPTRPAAAIKKTRPPTSDEAKEGRQHRIDELAARFKEVGKRAAESILQQAAVLEEAHAVLHGVALKQFYQTITLFEERPTVNTLLRMAALPPFDKTVPKQSHQRAVRKDKVDE